MISEKEFASGFTGFWAECLPLLTPQIVAEFNLSGMALIEGRRVWVKPMETMGDGTDNDVIAETAFGLFVSAIMSGKDVLTVAKNKALIKKIGSSAIERVLGLRGHWIVKRRNIETPIDEAIELSVRLEEYFKRAVGDCSKIVVHPQFKGCGMLNSCYGDLLAKKCLYEVKMVDRNMRSLDLRQVLIYCALNHRSQQYKIGTVTILNPRRGIAFSFKIPELVRRISGKTPPELFDEITDFLCSFEDIHQAS